MELKTFLKENEITSKEFAKAIEVDASSVSQYSTKNMTPTLETAAKIHFATKGRVSMLDLLTEEKKENVQRIANNLKKNGFPKIQRKRAKRSEPIVTIASIEL